MIVHRDRQHALGGVLADDIGVAMLEDFERRRHRAVLARGDTALDLFAADVVAQLDEFVAAEPGRPGNQLAYLVLRLAAEGEIEAALAGRPTQFRHESYYDE